MTADFLLELLCEEIPARMQSGARNDLARMFAQELDAVGISAAAIDVWSTPRRLVLIARGLPLQTVATREEIKGPRTNAPPQALEGFLRKTGLPHEQLQERDGVWFAVVEKPGQPMADLLGPAIERVIRAFPWPKSMRWGPSSVSTTSLRWVRPLHGIVALLGEEIVPVEIDGIRAGATTVGHRFCHPGPITIGGANDYAEKLRACHVIVDHDEREKLIRSGAEKAAGDARLNLVCDEGLVVENAGLTEWPVPLLGRFEPDYLDVPREVIVLTMRTNQKYFACMDDSGALAPAFVCIANIDAKDGGQAIVEGNHRVLAARLADARFFWEQDVKVPLEEQAKKLNGVVFHEKLGTVADKAERVAKLARWLVEEGIVRSCPERGGGPPKAVQGPQSLHAAPSTIESSFDGPPPRSGEDLAELAERAARLAKADLVTGMVGEFPELQGIIGGYLARAQGEPNAVADAIRDHYKPVGQGDEVPTAPVTVAVALADKVDSLVGFFFYNLAPTGSKDPFGLRRAALGLISSLVENSIRLPIMAFADQAIDRLAETWKGSGAFGRSLKSDALLGQHDVQSFELLEFFADRLKVQQREAGVRHDLVDAVFALGGEDDLVRLLARVKALQAFVEGDDGADLLTAYKRAANILKKEKWEGEKVDSRFRGNDDLASEERALIEALDAVEPQATQAIEAEDFTGAMRALAQLRRPIDAFFDHVTVNDPDPAKRERRLNLLARFRDAVHRVADFSRIEG